jgi:branched-chain amino acid transport system permease protein
VGAYAAASFVAWFASAGLPPVYSLLALLMASVAVAALLAPLVERGLLRVFYGRDEVLLVLVTYALFLIPRGRDRSCGDQPISSARLCLFGNVQVAGSPTWATTSRAGGGGAPAAGRWWG